MHGTNKNHAQRIAAKAQRLVRTRPSGCSGSQAIPAPEAPSGGDGGGRSNPPGSSAPEFVEVRSPQQCNAHDCGMYVLAVAGELAAWHTEQAAAAAGASGGAAAAPAAAGGGGSSSNSGSLALFEERSLPGLVNAGAVVSLRQALLELILQKASAARGAGLSAA